MLTRTSAAQAAERIRALEAEAKALSATLERERKKPAHTAAALEDKITELTALSDTRKRDLAKADAEVARIKPADRRRRAGAVANGRSHFHADGAQCQPDRRDQGAQ